VVRVGAWSDRRPVAVAVAVVAVVVAVAWGIAGRRPPGDHAERRASWNGVSWTVPAGWHVTDAGAEPRHYRAGSLVEGPFVSTVPTGPICRAMPGGWTCDRVDGIRTRPADGVVAWIMSGPLLAVPAANADPGPPPGACAGSPGGHAFHAFHAFRVLGAPPDGVRVTLDGCVYGPHLADHTAELTRIAESLTRP